mmetsp:Transcript_67536/g.206830  ORF Transcript_67536/g.206830 Transcript_67536/m.206830 type:complete len:257 (-) Transcript_67536:2894-3664(-)
MICSIVSTVTKRQMWIFRCCPGRRTRPTACISKATASSFVAASIGCTMITWFAAVRLVPLADSSKESNSILGLPSSNWNRVSAARLAHTLPCKLRCSTPNSSRAEPILRFRSSHCTKQMILWLGSSLRNFCTCVTNASIFEPYLAKTCCGLSSTTSPGAACVSLSDSWNEDNAFSLAPASAFKLFSCAAQLSMSAFQASMTLRSLSAFSRSPSHAQFASSRSAFAVPEGPAQRGMPKLDRSFAHLAGSGAGSALAA